MAKGVAATSDRGLAYDAPGLLAKLEEFQPQWIAFHGKEAAKAASRFLRLGADVRLGRQAFVLGDTKAFVVPSASGANRDPRRLEGRSTRAEWFEELRQLAMPPGAADL